MSVTLYEAMLDPALFGRTFAGPTFKNWRTVAKILEGLPLEADELELYQTITGRTDTSAGAARKAVREGYLIKDRRAGGTLFASAFSVHRSALSDYSGRLGPGEVATCALIASDRRQAKVALRYVKGLIADSPLISAAVTGETAEGVGFNNGTVVEVHVASFRSTRGYSFASVVLDELAYFRSDTSATPDTEIVRAVRPGLLNLGGKLLGLSSPHSRRGHLFAMWKAHFGRSSDIMVIKSGGGLLNPTLDREALDRQRAEDPLAARSEQDAEFREDISQFLPDADIDAALCPGVRSRPRQSGVVYTAHCDPSGGRHDSMALAISHLEASGQVLLDKLVVAHPPFTPETVVEQFAETLGAYGLNSVRGDGYAAEWVTTPFARHGITYQQTREDTSEIFVACLPLFSNKLVQLLDAPILETELRLLERRPRPGGKGDLVSHPPRGHDDVAIAALGSILAASRLEWSGRATSGIELRGRHVSVYDPWQRHAEQQSREEQSRDAMEAGRWSRYGR
jgi:hypothetical protein